MDTSEKTVLVTGGAGYIGSHTCKALATAGYTPVSLDNLSTGHADLVKWGPLEVGDVGDGKRVKDVLKKYRPSACIHFAGYIQVGESVLDPLKYYRNNVSGSIALLGSLLESGVMSFIFSSSAAVYGIPRISPIPDDYPPAPINPYGESKRIVEGILSDFAAAHGMRSVSLRYFNAAGADPAVLVADSSRAKAELGWEPRHSGLNEIIGTAWQFHSGRKEAKR